MRRTLTTLLTSTGLLLSALAAPALLAPADATTASASVAAAPAADRPAAQARGDKPTRDLHDSIVKRHGKLYFKGRVDPGHGPVIVQKKACSSKKCPWKVFKRAQTHGPKKRWQVRVYAPRHGNWYWRGYVKAYNGYAKSWTNKYKTYTTRF